MLFVTDKARVIPANKVVDPAESAWHSDALLTVSLVWLDEIAVNCLQTWLHRRARSQYQHIHKTDKHKIKLWGTFWDWLLQEDIFLPRYLLCYACGKIFVVCGEWFGDYLVIFISWGISTVDSLPAQLCAGQMSWHGHTSIALYTGSKYPEISDVDSIR